MEYGTGTRQTRSQLPVRPFASRDGKVERDTYTDNENREPNAIRQMTIFCRRPMYVTANLEKQLEQAYLPRLRPRSRVFYKI